MAQHGSSPPRLQQQGPARVHRPRPAPAPAPAPALVPAPPPPPPTEAVTLAAPRPDVERVVNEYVETPFRPATAPRAVTKQLARTGALALSLGPPTHRHHQALHLPKRPAAQPAATTFKKDASRGTAAAASPPAAAASATASAASTPTASGADCFRGSIICPECGRCRCEACRKPRSLPSRWLCHDSCYCSAETALDYASCLCCVKGLFYHCCRGDRDLEGADEPCSCGPPRCAARWGCLCVLSAVLPCLWCYWPLRACVGLCEACYRAHSARGCRCRPPGALLLDASPDF